MHIVIVEKGNISDALRMKKERYRLSHINTFLYNVQKMGIWGELGGLVCLAYDS